MSGASLSPSFSKMAAARFSTVPTETLRRSAVDWLFLPSAMLRRTPSSPGVSRAMRDPGFLERKAISVSTMRGSRTEPPDATSRMARTTCSTSPTRTLCR